MRILLGEISAEWNRILNELAHSDPELEIAGDVKNALDLLLHARELRADVVVISHLFDGSEPGICSHLLLEYPDLMVLLLPACSGRTAFIRTVLHKEELPNASKETLSIALKALKSNGS